MTSNNVARYTRRGSPWIGLLSTEGWDNICLTARNASSHVLSHENYFAFFISLLLASLGMNLESDVNLLTSR